MGTVHSLRNGAPPKLRAFVVEVTTEEGQYARYHAISTNSCAALIEAMDTWGIAKISISPRMGTRVM